MKIKILGWEYENIRRFGKLSIDLTKPDGSVYENTFIMMPNGTGKTTTLKLLRAVLTEKWTNEWKESDIRSFRPTFKDVSDKDVSEGKFSLKVMYNEEIYHYVLHLDYDLGEMKYETSRVAKLGGIEGEHLFPNDLRGVLTEDFVNRFAFDGEQAQKTLNNGSEEAERAIIFLYQLDKMNTLCDKIDKLIDIKKKEANRNVTARSVSLFRGITEKRKRKYDELCAQHNAALSALNSAQKKRNDYELKYQDIIYQDEQMRKTLEALNQEKWENSRQISETTSQLLDYMRRPYNLQMELHLRLQGLWRNMQTLKLPKSVAREFFNELADNKTCVCGRCIGAKEREAILRNSEDYLGQSEFVVLNEIKSTLKDYEVNTELKAGEKRLQDLMSEEQEILNALDRLGAVMAEKGNKQILLIKDAVEKLEQEINDLEERCKKLNARDDLESGYLTADNNIHLAYKAYQEAEAVYLKANGTFEFCQKAQKLKDYVMEVKKEALKKLKKYIIKETNDKVRQIIKNDNVVIENIAGHLVFKNRNNLSEGQNLAVAYAYIGTLFEHSQNEFPFIVDSPAAAFDLNMRREIAKIMPGLFQQMIIFVTSGERQGFVENYYQRSDVKYYTIDGERDKPVARYDGIAYFENFQKRGEGFNGV